ncbi:MAG: hypothetical protein IIY21_15295 [Clostridiales bacterium]|nr:hypothetical protein [Clostridiales bacterium]
MAVTAAFLAKVKTALRVSFNNLDSQITDLIEEAILDLTATADIKSFTTSNADALQTGAVIAYVSWKWLNDDRYYTAYNDIKAKMALSGTYRSVMVDEE